MSFLSKSVDDLLAIPSDDPEFHCHYDQCLWAIVTSSGADLVPIAQKVWEEPFINLPVPIVVAILRIAALESPHHNDFVSFASGSIAAFCDPLEELGATTTLKDWIAKHGQPTAHDPQSSASVSKRLEL